MPVLVTVTLPSTTGLPRDAVQNSFAVMNGEPITPANVGEITIPIAGFYNSVHADVDNLPLGRFIGPTVDRAALACSLKVYDLTGALQGQPHGSPIAEDKMTLVPGYANHSAIPHEVALCVTLRAAGYAAQPVEGADDADLDDRPERPRSRYTGRLYIGPLSNFAPDNGRPSTSLRNLALAAVRRTNLDLIANGHQLAVWSRESGVLRNVSHAQCDDAFDIQRRRGLSATVRTTRDVTV